LSSSQKPNVALAVSSPTSGPKQFQTVVFEDMTPISLKVFPIGANDITNDIALGLRIPLEEAEKIKRGGMTATTIPKKKLEEIINARLGRHL
jgi:cell division ATPase FtsA